MEYAQNIMSFLSVIGIPFVAIKGCEAELICGALVEMGIGSAVLTEDTDILLNDVRYWINGYTNAGKNVIVYDKKEMLKKLGITNKNFKKLCILLGSDYNKRIMGKVTAYNYIKDGTKTKEVEEKVNELITCFDKQKKMCMEVLEKKNLNTKDIEKSLVENISDDDLRDSLIELVASFIESDKRKDTKENMKQAAIKINELKKVILKCLE
jgi:hypothetical protein